MQRFHLLTVLHAGSLPLLCVGQSRELRGSQDGPQPSSYSGNESIASARWSALAQYEEHPHYNCYEGHGGAGSNEPLHTSLEGCAAYGKPCFVYMYSQGKCFLRDWCNAGVSGGGCEYGTRGQESWQFTTFTGKRELTWGGRLRFDGNGKCEALGLNTEEYEPYVLGLQDCNRKPEQGRGPIWQANYKCGNVVEMFRFGRWEKYVGVAEKEGPPTLGGFPPIETGQLYAVMHPGMPVPCNVGAKIELRPPPPAAHTAYGPSCLSDPSPAFQIYVEQGSINGCVTVLESQGPQGSPNVVKVQPCTSINDKSQRFTLQSQGCD